MGTWILYEANAVFKFGKIKGKSLINLLKLHSNSYNYLHKFIGWQLDK